MRKYQSTKKIILGSCAFRQPKAVTHCRYLHGYQLTAKFWFECNELDENNWVVDFGSLKNLKKQLRDKFDHKTIISIEDPYYDEFLQLHDLGLIDMVVFKNGVGIEKFAEHCFKQANKYIKILTKKRCWVVKCEIWEHETNSGVYQSETN